MKDLRQNYTKGELLESSVDVDPIVQFKNWFTEAEKSSVILEPNAMVLSTAIDNEVLSRVVLLKDIRDGEFVFYTNYTSVKAQHLEINPNCSILFPWVELERQVIIQGEATKISREESQSYFKSRPLASQLGAWSSDQSSTIHSRQELDVQMDDAKEKFKMNEVQIPPYWGGYAIKPHTFEFWQGRENRMHDRLKYSKNEVSWVIVRLQP